MKSFLGRVKGVLLLGIALSGSMAARADDVEADLKAYQQLLSDEVMAQPFSVEEMARIDSYIAEAMKNELVPEPYKGSQPWVRGMTCAHLNSYYARRDCRFYRHYYGRYYPY